MYCEKKVNSSSYYAKRFAAKEAFSKALGTGIRKGVNFKDIEISNNNHGKPYIKLKGQTAIFLKRKIKQGTEGGKYYSSKKCVRNAKGMLIVGLSHFPRYGR